MTALRPRAATTAPITLRERTVGDKAILAISGRLASDVAATTLTDRVALLVSRGFTSLVLDLTEVTYMDSAGLGGLIRTYAVLARTSGTLRLLGVTARLQHVLAITNLVSIFEIHDNEASALASFPAASVPAPPVAIPVALADAG